jgi:hypothetical protein
MCRGLTLRNGPLALLWVVVGLACVGCQTFSLTEQQFEAQQRGCTVDPETGMLVGVAGYAGMLGAAIAQLAHK